MKFSAVVDQVLEKLQRQRRISYRALKREFELDDDYIEDLKAEIIDARRLAIDEDGKVLVWIGKGINGETGEDGPESRVQSSESENQRRASAVLTLDSRRQTLDVAAERRQLTVMFCDLVGSTALSEQLDSEELREVVRLYQETCTAVIQRYDGHVAQHLGDGLLVYFGYPTAHEDDAQRAVRTGLEIILAIQEKVPSPLVGEGQGEGVVGTTGRSPLQVRIGIHTGLVVIGEIGSGEKREVLALGETPNIAARVQGVAEPDTVVMSTVTRRLVQGLFACQDLGPQTLKGISTPLSLYRVIGESAAQNRFEVAVGAGLTPLVGREEELGLLQRRWTQAKDGAGQVVLLSGEAGIGKSRLVQALKEQVLTEGATRIEFRCSPYHQNSAFYPIIDHLQRLLQFAHNETPQAKLTKLQHALTAYRFPQADTLPLLAALLSLPQPEGVPPLTLSPQKQKQKTQEALVAWIVEEAERAAVYCTWEDLHWVDPSTLEVLTLFLEQIPTARVFSMLTFRPDFTPTWSPRSYLTQLTLSRLGRLQVEAMVEQVTGGKALPLEVMQQIVTKTDGVPLFVEELTKTVLESVGSIESIGSTIPATLQGALMARLDRLGTAKEAAQLGATLGREFSYELIQAVSPMGEPTLQQAINKLIEAEILYQRGLPPQATYLFKHALIQDTAYQSLLKSKRQQLHQQIAQVLADRFSETIETQPELLAHHYTEAGLKEQAIPYWQKAGQRASQRSANAEAVSHLTKGLELLQALPDTPERIQHELMLQIALGTSLIVTKGQAAPEVERVYARAQELCQQLGEIPQLFPVLHGLYRFYVGRAEYKPARKLAEQLLSLAQSVQDLAFLLAAHMALEFTLLQLGEFVPARRHLEQAIALYDPQKHNPYISGAVGDPGVICLTYGSLALWLLGYPDQAAKKNHEALILAQELSHPYSSAHALNFAASLYQFRREGQATQERAEAAITLCAEQGFALHLAMGIGLRGWSLAEQGQRGEGIAQIRRGLAAFSATGTVMGRSYYLALLAEAYGKGGQTEEGLTVVAEALALVDKTGECYWEAELYRLKGTLTLQKLSVISGQLSVTDPRPLTPDSQGEAEACFLKAIDIARQQQAKSLELRATVSLARLWQQQALEQEAGSSEQRARSKESGVRSKEQEARTKLVAAHRMLSEVYHWFTEGFDTKDLQEAKALLQELASRRE